MNDVKRTDFQLSILQPVDVKLRQFGHFFRSRWGLIIFPSGLFHSHSVTLLSIDNNHHDQKIRNKMRLAIFDLDYTLWSSEMNKLKGPLMLYPVEKLLPDFAPDILKLGCITVVSSWSIQNNLRHLYRSLMERKLITVNRPNASANGTYFFNLLSQSLCFARNQRNAGFGLRYKSWHCFPVRWASMGSLLHETSSSRGWDDHCRMLPPNLAWFSSRSQAWTHSPLAQKNRTCASSITKCTISKLYRAGTFLEEGECKSFVHRFMAATIMAKLAHHRPHPSLTSDHFCGQLPTSLLDWPPGPFALDASQNSIRSYFSK